MGGTLIRLVDQGHDVHVAYQTSGNIAVFSMTTRFGSANSWPTLTRNLALLPKRTAELEEHIETFLRNKKAGQVDSPEVQAIKTLIRQGEARAATRLCGVPETKLHFLNMPFYETGTVKKKPLGELTSRSLLISV